MSEITAQPDKTRERCPVCDRPIATEEEWATVPEGEGEDLCWGTGDSQCLLQEQDWRARYLAEKEAHIESFELHEATGMVLSQVSAIRESAERALKEVDCTCRFAPGTIPGLRIFTCHKHEHFDKWQAPDVGPASP